MMIDTADEHVDDALIAAYLDRTLATEDLDHFENHLSGCAACRMTVVEAARLIGSARRRRRRAIGVGLAAAAVLATVLLVPRSSPIARDTVRSVAAESLAIEVLTEWNGNANTPANFTWRSISGTLQYRFELVTVSGRLVWDSTTTDTTMVVPRDLTRSPDSLLWSVDALVQNGSAVSTGYRQIDRR